MPVPEYVEPKSSGKPLGYKILNAITVLGIIVPFCIGGSFVLAGQAEQVLPMLGKYCPAIAELAKSHGVGSIAFGRILTFGFIGSLLLAFVASGVNSWLFGSDMRQDQINGQMRFVNKLSTLQDSTLLRALLSLAFAYFIPVSFVLRMLLHIPYWPSTFIVAVVAYQFIIPKLMEAVVQRPMMTYGLHAELQRDGFKTVYLSVNDGLSSEGVVRGVPARVSLNLATRDYDRSRQIGADTLVVSVALASPAPLVSVISNDAAGPASEMERPEIDMPELAEPDCTVGADDRAAGVAFLQTHMQMVKTILQEADALAIEPTDEDDPPTACGWITAMTVLRSKDLGPAPYRAVLDSLVTLATTVNAQQSPL